MLSVRTTSEPVPAELAEIRRLLDEAFDGDFNDDDWMHCVGGVHVLAYSGEALVAHGSVVSRTLRCGGRSFRTGYVEAVAVRPGLQGKGHGRTVMQLATEQIKRGYELGALCASDRGLGFYQRLGWLLWRGPSYVDAPEGLLPTPDEDGAVLVLPVSEQPDLDQPIVCDWREGDVW